MQYEILATDYDGTLASDGIVAPSTIQALERLRATGRRAWMVTGREIEDLSRIFSRLDLFDVIVAENGGVLFYPETRELRVLHGRAPVRFVDEMRRRGVHPLSVGRVLVATAEPNDAVALDVIKKLGLELEIIFNKGSVMVLPTGVNKATGLATALKEREIDPEKVVGIGDAENDHAFLRLCGCAAAVANALPSLKKRADVVTNGIDGTGVTELIELLIATDLSAVQRMGSAAV